MAGLHIEWEAQEYVHVEKSSDWYWAVGIITVAAIVTAVIFSNILFALVILLSVIALTMHVMNEPPLRRYVLTDRGVHTGDIFYPFSTLESYWVEEGFYPLKVLIKSKKFFMPYIIIPLSDELDPDEIRDYMDVHLPAVEHHEPFLHKLLEYLGF